MNEQWIEQMRQKMAGYKRPAPEVSWEELDRALVAGKAHKYRQLWLRRIVAVIVVLLIAGVGYWGLLYNNPEQKYQQTVSIKEHDGRLGDSDQNKEAFPEKFKPAPVTLAKSAQRSSMVEVPIQKSQTIIPVSTANPDTVNTITTIEKERPDTVEEKPKNGNYPEHVIYPTDFYQRKHLDNRLTAKVYISSTMAGKQTGISENQNMAEIKDSLQTLQTEQYIHHRQPIRFGLSFRYRLNDRWSVEGGLSYTRLSSDITITENGVTTVTEQQLNYIGLPLKINYEFWKSNHFGLYISAGGTIEKRLDAILWQFSLNGSVGAEYKLTNVFSLYAEPGIGYYFKDGSSIPTIYKDHPLNFNLNIGLRFNLKNPKDS